MTQTAPITETASPSGDPAVSDVVDAPVVVSDVLVEEVSIDGMCGVY